MSRFFNKPTRFLRSLKRLVLRLVCLVFGHQYTRTEYIGSMRVESSRTCDGEPMCYRCHPTPTLAEEVAEYEKSENKPELSDGAKPKEVPNA